MERFHPLMKKISQFPPEEEYLDPEAYVPAAEPAPDVQTGVSCLSCRGQINPETAIGYGEEYLCEKCAKKCPWCNSIFPAVRLKTENPVCDSCNKYVNTKCTDCEDGINFGELKKDPWDNDVCEWCFGYDYAECSNCEKIVDKEDSRDNENGDPICEECFSDEYISCENCNKTAKFEESAFVDQEAFYCKECAEDLHCDTCGNYWTTTENRTIGEREEKMCEKCFWNLYEDGEIGQCHLCYRWVEGENIHYTHDGSECLDCYGGSDNIRSFYELKDAAERQRFFNETVSDLEYYKEAYPNVFNVPEDFNKKKRKSWNYIQKWTGGFDYIPQMNVKVTRPSTDYEGTYIEFHLDDMKHMAEEAGVSSEEMWDMLRDFNWEHPCLVSGDPERMIVSRVLVDDAGNWNVKLMQGSANQEAKATKQEVLEAIRSGEVKCERCKGYGHGWRGSIARPASCEACNGKGKVPVIDEKELSGWEMSKGEEEAEKMFPKEYGGRDPLEKFKKINYKTKQELEKKAEQLDKIVKMTNGAYLAAYDWIKNLAQSQKANCYVEIPDTQASQHPDAPKISLEVIYGGIPFLMGFGKEKIKRGEHPWVGKKEKTRYKMAKENSWSFEDIARIVIFDPLLR